MCKDFSAITEVFFMLDKMFMTLYSTHMNRQALNVDAHFSKLFNRVIARASRYGQVLEPTHLMNKVKLAIRNIAQDGNTDWVDARNNTPFDYSKTTPEECYFALYHVTRLLELNGYEKKGRI